MRRAVLVALLLIATGCGGAAEPQRKDDRAGKVALEAICPGAHQVYDALVASNPASQAEFVEHLQSLRVVGNADARGALAPVITAAEALAEAGRGPDFSAAQDGIYQAVVGLDSACREVGAFILH